MGAVWALVIATFALWVSIAPQVWAVCTYQELYTFSGEAANDWSGYSVSGAGDVNKDGYADLIVGAHLNNAGGTNAGRAYVYSCPVPYLCGDVNADAGVKVSDVVYLVNYLLKGGPKPSCE